MSKDHDPSLFKHSEAVESLLTPLPLSLPQHESDAESWLVNMFIAHVQRRRRQSVYALCQLLSQSSHFKTTYFNRR